MPEGRAARRKGRAECRQYGGAQAACACAAVTSFSVGIYVLTVPFQQMTDSAAYALSAALAAGLLGMLTGLFGIKCRCDRDGSEHADAEDRGLRTGCPACFAADVKFQYVGAVMMSVIAAGLLSVLVAAAALWAMPDAAWAIYVKYVPNMLVLIPFLISLVHVLAVAAYRLTGGARRTEVPRWIQSDYGWE